MKMWENTNNVAGYCNLMILLTVLKFSYENKKYFENAKTNSGWIHIVYCCKLRMDGCK